MEDQFIEARLGTLTDKFSLGYYPVYKELLAGKEDASVLEIGTAYGGSLKMWHELVPQGYIVGVSNHAPVEEPAWAMQLNADQADPNLPELLDYKKFDLIVDDASHMGSKSRETFKLLWPLVRPGGWYVLEDWSVGMHTSPYFPAYEGNSMLKLAQSFIEHIAPDDDLADMGGTAIPRGERNTASEVRYRYGMAMLRKNA